MTSYDTFAPFYDATMSDRPEPMPVIHAALEQYGPNVKSILELACGTGTILTHLVPQYSVMGLDMSAEMLRIAQRKLPDIPFVQGDMSEFELSQTFDAVLCIFDSINHLPNFKSWQRMFARVAQHLNAGGLFIFDINTTGRMHQLTTLGSLIQTNGDTTIELAITPAGRDAVDWHITVQEPQPDGLIQVHEDHARERSYPLTQVLRALEPHFQLLDHFDADNLPASDNSARIYIILQKL